MQMQAAQAENAYNQWVQEMAFAQNQWEYEQARYNAELAYQQSLAAQEAERQDKENLIAYAQTVGDWDLYGSLTGTDTSYMSALQAAELADLYNTGSSRRSRSSGGSRGSGGEYEEPIKKLLGGTPSTNGIVDEYINNAINNSGRGAIAVGGINQPLTADQIRQYLVNGDLQADVTGNRVTIGTPAYFNALR